MNYIIKNAKKRSTLILEDRQPLSIDTSGYNLYYNPNNNGIQIDVLKQFAKSLTNGLTVNNVVISSQATFDAANKFLFSDALSIYNTMQDAVNAGLGDGDQYITPITAGNYSLAVVYLPAAPPIVGTVILNEDGTIQSTEDNTPIITEQ